MLALALASALVDTPLLLTVHFRGVIRPATRVADTITFATGPVLADRASQEIADSLLQDLHYTRK
jgi:hypothetical protein